MPVEITSITPFPSFMSVIGKAGSSIEEDMARLQPDTIHSDGQIFVTDSHLDLGSTGLSSQSLHHRDSVTSMTTASTDSSPTTTNSTFDSPLIPDPSPSSSPESASTNLPILPFRNTMVKDPLAEAAGSESTRGKETLLDPLTKSEGLVGTTKNVKSLSLNMGSVVLPRPATSHGFESSLTFSAPPSPLKDTPRTGRKKPANLTIRTPGFQQQTFSRALEVPPTPSSRPSLHHIQSSPALTSLASPGKPPPRGLFLQLPASGNIHSSPSTESSNAAESANSTLPELKEEDEYHLQRSQETQEKGYPKGPVLVYDAGVYLYLEPTADEASDFDTVINVAKEIKCPLTQDAPMPSVSEPQTAISEMSFKSAWEWPRPSEIQTPTTPRQDAVYPRKQPEYLHVPWDHNSEILEDLYTLCRLIDERVQAGKRVLIHCQLGVSRSASLVIAYGLFKGYQPDFHAMYMSVKQRSQWVGPNMSLIYQLTDFRAKVVKGAYGDHSYNPSPTWWKMQASDSVPTDLPVVKRPLSELMPQNTGSSGTAASTTVSVSLPKARALPPLRVNKVLPPVPLFPNDDRDILATPVNHPQPPRNTTTESRQQDATRARSPPAGANSSSRSISPRPLPFREQFDGGLEPISSPLKPSKTPRLGAWTTSPKMDLALQDVPGSPTLLSPRAAEFMASPFGITSAGDLAVPAKELFLPQENASIPPVTSDQVPTAVDPRSPHQQGENVEIFRNIDGFL